MTRSRSRRSAALVAGVVSLSMLAAACGGSSGGGSSSKPTTKPTSGVNGGDSTNKKAQPGGEIKYGLEADTTGGYCLQEAQLAISGIQVARALYDTLTLPGKDGQIHPYLAQSVTPNADNTQFTIVLRSGIKFSDGSALDADIVRDNLLAYAGLYKKTRPNGAPMRSPLLFKFVFANLKDVTSDGKLTVTATTKTPWPAFPWFLWSSSRLGIVGRAQLDDPVHCNTNTVGTGPFKLQEAVANQRIVVVKNPNYWQKDAAGVQLPYLDKITFVPVSDEQQRYTALKAGDLQIMHTSSYNNIASLRKDRTAGTLNSIESNKFGEVSYLLLNGQKEPFNDLIARQAVAYAQDRNLGNQRLNQGLGTLAAGPFAPGSEGYLDDSGYPQYDLKKAKDLVAQYKTKHGKDLQFTYTYAADTEGQRTAEFLQQIMREAGIKVTLKPVTDQSTLINLAIARGEQAIGWRNHPGGDPDLQYVWWHCDNTPPAPCDNLVNFGAWNDPEINRLLEDGRKATDPAARKAIYENLNRQFAKSLWDLWSGYTLWSIASSPKVHGVFGPNLPDGTEPSDGLATGHSLLGLWIEH